MTCNDTHTHCHSCWSMICKDMFCIHIHCHSCWCNDMQGYVLHSHTLPFLLMQTFCMDTHWMDTHRMDTYWWDTCWTDTYWWDTYWWDTFGMDMCGICVVWWICVGYVWCEIRQQSSEEPCDETSFGKNEKNQKKKHPLLWKLLHSSAVKRWSCLVLKIYLPIGHVEWFQLIFTIHLVSQKKPSKKNFGRCRFLRCFPLAARPLQICFPVNGFGFCRKSRSQRSGQEVPVSAEACKRWQFVQPCPTLSKLKKQIVANRQTSSNISPWKWHLSFQFD